MHHTVEDFGHRHDAIELVLLTMKTIFRLKSIYTLRLESLQTLFWHLRCPTLRPHRQMTLRRHRQVC